MRVEPGLLPGVKRRKVRVDGSRGREAPANGRYRAALGEWLVPRSGGKLERDSESGVRDVQSIKRIIIVV